VTDPPADPRGTLAEALWERYAGDLETALHTMELDLAAGRVPAPIRLQAPDERVPAYLRGRCEILLDRLREVTARAQERQDQLAADMARLPHQRPADRQRASSLGFTLDVTG
jgi:hypothetical protein